MCTQFHLDDLETVEEVLDTNADTLTAPTI